MHNLSFQFVSNQPGINAISKILLNIFIVLRWPATNFAFIACCYAVGYSSFGVPAKALYRVKWFPDVRPEDVVNITEQSRSNQGSEMNARWSGVVIRSISNAFC